MTKTAMNNSMRTKAAVKNNDALIKGFKAHGYKVLVGPWNCAACRDEMTTAAQSVGYTGDVPPWGNANIALKFKKGKTTIAACRCGWRKDISMKFKPIEKPKCKVRGCHAVLNKADTDGLCVKCRNEIAGGGNPATYAADCDLKPHRGCDIYVQEGRPGCIRTKCSHYHGPAIPVNKAYVTCGCGTVLPNDRKKFCYTCRPRTMGKVDQTPTEGASKAKIDM